MASQVEHSEISWQSYLRDNSSVVLALLQFLAICGYFLIYYYTGAIWGLLYSGFFMLREPFHWAAAFEKHINDQKLRWLAITIFTSFCSVIFFFANLYEILDLIYETGSTNKMTTFGDFLYFSTVTFTTLGYGEYIPQGYAKIAAAIQALIGLGYFSFIIGISSAIFYARIDKKNRN
ncbi:MAG: hypothetical protein ACI9LM_004824 [Alteromonadaceae bacterium]|jgi:hypothetical protein